MNKVYKQLIDYQERDLDDDFIYDAFLAMMEDEVGLEPFIKDFDIKRDEVPGNDLGTYDFNERVILIYPDVIREKRGFSEEDRINIKLQALKTIRHEIEHARDLQTLHKRGNDIESTIIRYALRSYALRNGLEFNDPYCKEDLFWLARKKENYRIDPEERLADIRASRYLVNLLKNQNRTADLLAVRKMLFFSYIRGYTNNGYYIDSPAYQFLLKTGLYHQFYLFKKRVEEEHKYSFDTRLEW